MGFNSTFIGLNDTLGTLGYTALNYMATGKEMKWKNIEETAG
jgi:hypothetical protein